ncbi:hypothetical protein ACLESD_15360 [Pyxidicoccus sp. 3LFB2]
MKKRRRTLFVRDWVPVRSGPRPAAEAPGDAQVTTMMVGEESDNGVQR